jgi:indole-3-glycerol phosphate synthase
MKLKAPSTFLDGILNRAILRVSADKVSRPVHDLKMRIADAAPPVSFQDGIGNAFGLIAEIKRKSPSQGKMLCTDVDYIARIYESHPFVRAISVLTNRDDFSMSIDDLAHIRTMTAKPILRKDFIFDEYQVYEARAFGADAILLMASVVTDHNAMKGLFDLATGLGLDVLFECRSQEEIESIPTGAKIYGINSRKLKARQWFGLSRYTFSRWGRHASLPDASVQPSSFDLVVHIPHHAMKVAESGLSPRDIHGIRSIHRYNCALVGTGILNAPNGVVHALDSFAAEGELQSTHTDSVTIQSQHGHHIPA